MNKDSRIYIPGHNGFVGKTLYKHLIDNGYTNVITFEKDNINLLNQDDVESIFIQNEIEYVFNCAGRVGGIQANILNPYKFLFENLQIQNNLIDNAIKFKVKKFLNLGSSCIYPKDYIQPLKEEYLMQGPLEETNSSYALAKICGLKLCEVANKQFDTKFVSLMPSNIYGPDDCFDLEKSHVLSALIKKIYDAKRDNKKEIVLFGTGMPRREFLYIDDLIDGMIWTMKNIDKSETFFNIGTGEDIQIIELADKIAKIIGWNGKLMFDKTKPDGMMVKRMDVSKINALGWIAKTSLDDGLKKTIEWYVIWSQLKYVIWSQLKNDKTCK